MSKARSFFFKGFIFLIFIFSNISNLFSMISMDKNYLKGQEKVAKMNLALERMKTKRYLRRLRFVVKNECEDARSFYNFLQKIKDEQQDSQKKQNIIKEKINKCDADLKNLTEEKREGDDAQETYLEKVERIRKCKTLLTRFDSALKNSNSEEMIEILEEADGDINALNNEWKRLDAELSGYSGDIIFRGIAGEKNWAMVEDIKVGDDLWEGFKNGVMLRGSVSVGNAIGGRIEGWVEQLFNVAFGNIEDFIGFIYRFVFHSSCKSFNVDEITHWKKLIGNDLQEVEFMIKNIEKFDSRGRAEILREYESEEPANDTINLWREFIEDLAITYEDLAREIEIRKNHYSKNQEGFGIVNCADRLKNKLLKTKDLFLRVKSLKDLANLPEAKSIIPAMKKSFNNYFDNLADQVRPLAAKKAGRSSSNNSYTSSSYGNNRWNSDSTYNADSLADSYPTYG